jgi:hypothetical protein
MILAEHTKDAKFYSLVHSVLESERRRDLDERRGGRRHAYRCLQLIAPAHEARMPDQSEFRQVQCVDLSSNGFAYLATEEPPSDRLIVVLGVEPFICLLADVVRREEVVHEGQRMHRVACRFSGRVEAQERDCDRSAFSPGNGFPEV